MYYPWAVGVDLKRSRVETRVVSLPYEDADCQTSHESSAVSQSVSKSDLGYTVKSVSGSHGD